MKLELILGKNSAGVPLIWKDPKNGHICITGNSGNGKSYELKYLAPQLPGQGICAIIFDCSGDFLPGVSGGPHEWSSAQIRVINLRDPKLRIDPFLPIHEDESAAEIADRLSDTLRTCLKLGAAQWVTLSNLLTDGLEEGSMHTFDDLVTRTSEETQDNDAAKRLLIKLKKVNNMLPKGTVPLRWELDKPGITVLDLHRIGDPAAQAILIELLLGTICSPRFAGVPSEDHPVVMIFDECQRLNLRTGSYANRILREGRKFGLHGWFSTQWISDPEQRRALEQAALRIYFHPGQSDVHRTVLSLGLKNKQLIPRYESRISSFRPGEFLYRDGPHIYFNCPN